MCRGVVGAERAQRARRWGDGVTSRVVGRGVRGEGDDAHDPRSAEGSAEGSAPTTTTIGVRLRSARAARPAAGAASRRTSPAGGRTSSSSEPLAGVVPADAVVARSPSVPSLHTRQLARRGPGPSRLATLMGNTVCWRAATDADRKPASDGVGGSQLVGFVWSFGSRRLDAPVKDGARDDGVLSGRYFKMSAKTISDMTPRKPGREGLSLPGGPGGSGGSGGMSPQEAHSRNGAALPDICKQRAVGQV